MIGLSALFTSCITPAASWPTAARRRSRARASWSASSSRRALLHHALETLGFRRHSLVQLGGAARFFLERFRELRLHRDVALDGDRAANLAVLVVERIRVDLDDHRRAVGAATHGERLAAHALAAQRARRRMLVHEQARAVDRARTIELPELAQRRRLAGG